MGNDIFSMAGLNFDLDPAGDIKKKNTADEGESIFSSMSSGYNKEAGTGFNKAGNTGTFKRSLGKTAGGFGGTKAKSKKSTEKSDTDNNYISGTVNLGRPDDVDDLTQMIMPSTKPKTVRSQKPQIVVIDDDFATLDLMKIYLQREYDFISFDNPKEAIFYLNKHIPSMIFLDCYITMIRCKKVIEILRSYPEYEKVPIYLLVEPDEKGAMEAKVEKGEMPKAAGFLTRPVARGELQKTLDEVFKDNKDKKSK